MVKAPATVNRYKVTFSSIYRYGRQRDKVAVNPAREVRQRKLNNGVIRYLKPEEEKQFGPQLAKEWRGHLLAYRSQMNESDVRKLIEGK